MDGAATWVCEVCGGPADATSPATCQRCGFTEAGTSQVQPAEPTPAGVEDDDGDRGAYRMTPLRLEPLSPRLPRIFQRPQRLVEVKNASKRIVYVRLRDEDPSKLQPRRQVNSTNVHLGVSAGGPGAQGAAGISASRQQTKESTGHNERLFSLEPGKEMELRISGEQCVMEVYFDEDPRPNLAGFAVMTGITRPTRLLALKQTLRVNEGWKIVDEELHGVLLAPNQ